MEARIRTAIPSDLKAVLSLLRELDEAHVALEPSLLRPFSDPPRPSDWLLTRFADPNEACFVAEVDERVVGFVWSMHELDVQGRYLVVPAVVITWGAALLMVSNIRFASFKQVKLAERVPFRYLLFALGLFALFLMYPPHTFFVAFLCYALSGPLMALYRRTSHGRALAGRDTPPSL